MDLHLMYQKYSKSLWAVIDLLAALGLIVLVNGLRYPNSDATNLITLTYKLQDPNLFTNDISFSASPLGYSAFFILLLEHSVKFSLLSLGNDSFQSHFSITFGICIAPIGETNY